jgi:hypothetical protein
VIVKIPTIADSARLWRPWIRIQRLIRVILGTRWGADECHSQGRTPDRAQGAQTAETGRVVQLGVAKRSAKPETTKTLAVLPVQLRPGDTFTDKAGTWEVVGQPKAQHAGQSVVARVQRPGDPGTIREQWWRAHERVTVKRTSTT